MKGFVPTPDELVDVMVGKLFSRRAPRATDSLLDAGCGPGAFIAGVLRWCELNRKPIPQITGIDSDPALLSKARQRFRGTPQVTLLAGDFLDPSRTKQFDYIIGNPPYVPITGLTVDERDRYRNLYLAASGRFDLYLLFFEQALHQLSPDGRLVFITPEKFMFVQTAAPVRRLLAAAGVEEIELRDESSFPNLVTYPAITTVDGSSRGRTTRIETRDGDIREAMLPANGSSWLHATPASQPAADRRLLIDAAIRISCGVATGADSVYVISEDEMPPELREFAYPTIAGRQLRCGTELRARDYMLVPYTSSGELLGERQLGPLREYLRRPVRLEQLKARTCVVRKPWYAFHETPPLADMLRPKILCKDIGSTPWFVVDRCGIVIPRHSVYYIVPRDESRIDELCRYLNSPEVREFLMAHSQRAANGFIRLQSHVLKQVPIPERLAARALALPLLSGHDIALNAMAPHA